MKKLIIAMHAGFCMGVSRAIEQVLELIDKNRKGKIYTYGELIHNPQTIKKLTEKGVRTVHKEDELPDEGILILRTHGVKPEVYEKARKNGLKIIDLTCPFVLKVQKIIEKHSSKEEKILILGDEGHSEVEGYMGWSKGKGIVIDKVEKIENSDIKGKICVVAQTTLDRRRFDEIVKQIKKKNNNIIVYDTICNATGLRQNEALKISKYVECMVVIGGKNSANSKRLAHICSENHKPVRFIESVNEFKEGILLYNVIGLTAGASTPDYVIQDVIKYFEDNGYTKELYNKNR